jgi:kynurenine formamidase
MLNRILPAIAVLSTAAFLTAAPPLQAQDQPDWCKSKWGPDDEIGAANLITPDSVMAASKLVTTGKVYALGGETNATTPAFAPRTWSTTILQPGQVGGVTLGPTKSSYNDDIYMGWVGTGSQIDGLGHLGVDHVYYNCNKAADFVKPDGLTKLGIEKIPPLVARGVVLDMTAVTGQNPVPEGTPFNRAEIDAALEKQGTEIRRGDVVLFHTGWQGLVGQDNQKFISAEPGLGKEGAEYLASLEVMAVGADTWGLEAVPFEEGVGVFEIHQILLAKNGIYILENMNTAELVSDQAWEFMFVEGHGRITGGVQAIINPVAIR